MEKFIHKFGIFKNGFTLAEVLITLVIVGVVASLTISAVINTYVESSTVAKVKKGLSTVAQAKKLAEAQNGSIECWNYGQDLTAETAAQFWSYLKPHFSIAKDCGSDESCYQSNGVYGLNGSLYSVNFNTRADYYKFVLADGSVMMFSTQGGRCSNQTHPIPNVCAVFLYDTNGDKKPNTVGKDIFVYLMDANNVYPHEQNSCTKTSWGWGCSGYIIKHNNMKYLH